MRKWQHYFAALLENKNYYWLHVEMLNNEPIISIDSTLISWVRCSTKPLWALYKAYAEVIGAQFSEHSTENCSGWTRDLEEAMKKKPPKKIPI